VKKTIGLITYDVCHRKTYDIACLLKAKGYNDVIMLRTKYIYRPERHPLIQHRPEGFYVPHPIDIAKNFGWDYVNYGQVKCDEYLIGGCNVIPGLDALNAHPGYLPYVKGLDALKWSIYYRLPVGVSVHRTIDEPDSGDILMRKIVPAYFEDTFHSLAQRVYNYEIEMLVASIERTIPFGIDTSDDVHTITTIHKRMPAYKEAIMLKIFEENKNNRKSIYDV